MMYRFQLQRDVDHSGVSGTGHVAEGVEFTDGTVVVRWLPGPNAEPTTVVHPGIGNVMALHGHNGDSHLIWLDPRS